MEGIDLYYEGEDFLRELGLESEFIKYIEESESELDDQAAPAQAAPVESATPVEAAAEATAEEAPVEAAAEEAAVEAEVEAAAEEAPVEAAAEEAPVEAAAEEAPVEAEAQLQQQRHGIKRRSTKVEV